MAIPHQELPQSRAQETLNTADKLSDLSGRINTISPALLEERSNVLDRSWNDQQILASQVQPSAFNNPYATGAMMA